jgi:hypothetical protein
MKLSSNHALATFVDDINNNRLIDFESTIEGFSEFWIDVWVYADRLLDQQRGDTNMNMTPEAIEAVNLKNVVRRENPVQEEYCTHIRANGECCLAAAAALAKAFVWAETEDGFDYWHYVWLTLTEIGEVASAMEARKKPGVEPKPKKVKKA